MRAPSARLSATSRGVATARLVATIVALVATVAGCTAFTGRADDAQLRRQAQDALDRWAAAVARANASNPVVIVGDPTGQIGDWEAEVGDNNKRALMAGMISVTAPLPAMPPADGVVTWEDGTSKPVPLLSAQDALDALIGTSSGGCADCTPLRVTGAALGTGQVATSRGRATAPTWQFSLAGTRVKITRIAVAGTPYVNPPETGFASAIGIHSATVTRDGQAVTVSFVGAGPGADKPCGADYTAEAVESDLAVVVIVTEHRYPFPETCADVGYRRTAVATLARPLGDRVVLNLVTGQPVSVTVVP